MPVTTPAPPAARDGLGTRQEAQTLFEPVGFTGGTVDRLNDGRERFISRHADGHFIEIIGPAGAVEQISLAMQVTDATSTDAGVLTGLLVGWYAPEAGEWVSSNLEPAIAGQSVERRFGGTRVSMSGLPASDGSLLVVTVGR